MAAPRSNGDSDSAGDSPREHRPDDRPGDSGVRDDRGVSDDKERWRLAWHYADMTDGEIESLAAESSSLTEVAQRALQSELHRRGLRVELAEPAAAAAAGPQAASPSRSRKLATVSRFRDMPEALLAKSVLESAGIECLLADANIIRTDWLWSNLVGGVKLRVREEDLEEATRILDQDLPPEPIAAPGDEDFQPPNCPRCKSQEVSLDDLRQSAAAAAGSSADRRALPEPVWTCHSCGHQWHDLDPSA
jgi:hypothetical protein